jgi:hypothetical protein
VIIKWTPAPPEIVAVPSLPFVKAVDCHLPTTQESTFDVLDPECAAPDPAGEASGEGAEAPEPPGEEFGAPPATADGLGDALDLAPLDGPEQDEMSANEIGTANAFNAFFIRNVLRSLTWPLTPAAADHREVSRPGPISAQ